MRNLSPEIIDHPFSQKLYLSSNDGVHLINIPNIIRAEASSNYSVIICKDGTKYVMTKSLKYLQEKLPKHQFLRIHKSHIVRIDAITSIRNKQIQLSNDHVIPRSKTYNKSLIDLLKFIK